MLPKSLLVQHWKQNKQKIVKDNFLFFLIKNSIFFFLFNIQSLDMSLFSCPPLYKTSSFTGHGLEVIAGTRIWDGNFSPGAHKWELKKLHNSSIKGSCQGEAAPPQTLNITLVQLAFPSGSSVGLTESTGSSSQSLGQEPSWGPKFHPLGWRWRASGHTNDLSVLFFWQKSEWNANTNLPQKIPGEEQLRGADVKFGGQITC